MTFDELKNTILRRARKFGMCESFHELINATTYDELIVAGLPVLEYGARTGILSTDLIEEFDNDLRVAHGVFYEITGTVTDPPAIPFPYFGGFELWFINSTINVSFSGVEKYRVNAIGSTVVINVADTAYVNVLAANSTVTCNGSDESLICADIRNEDGSAATFNMENNARADVRMDNNTAGAINITDTPFVLLKTFKTVVANVNIAEDEDVVFGIADDQSQIIYAAP